MIWTPSCRRASVGIRPHICGSLPSVPAQPRAARDFVESVRRAGAACWLQRNARWHTGQCAVQPQMLPISGSICRHGGTSSSDISSTIGVRSSDKSKRLRRRRIAGARPFGAGATRPQWSASQDDAVGGDYPPWEQELQRPQRGEVASLGGAAGRAGAMAGRATSRRR